MHYWMRTCVVFLMILSGSVFTAADASASLLCDRTYGTSGVDANPGSNNSVVAGHERYGAATAQLDLNTSAGRSEEGPRELVFIEGDVADYPSLVEGRAPGKEYFILNPTRPGLEQVAKILEGKSGIRTLHLVTHGSEGGIHLGTETLTEKNLFGHSAALEAVGRALGGDAEILLYGCNVARGARGASFVSALAEATGATVAASTDITGSRDGGGDSVLEFSTGRVTSEVLAGLSRYSHTLVASTTTYTFDSDKEGWTGDRFGWWDGAISAPTNSPIINLAPPAAAYIQSLQIRSYLGTGNNFTLRVSYQGSVVYSTTITYTQTAYSTLTINQNVDRLEFEISGAGNGWMYPEIDNVVTQGVVNLNAPPTAANNTVYPLAGEGFGFNASHFGYQDADGDPLAKVTIVTVPAAGTLVIPAEGGRERTLTNGATVTKEELAAGSLRYTPSGSTDSSFTFKVNDGTDDSVATYTMTLDVVSAPKITGVSSTTADGTYKAGDTVAVTVTFDQAVTVTGAPQLTLETGATDAVVNYASGSGANTLTFNYTVAAGHASVDLDYTGTAALALNAGTIRGEGNIDAVLTLASPGASGSLGAGKAIVIDGVKPTVSSVSVPAAGTYGVFDTLDFTVTFGEPVTVSGTASKLGLTVGSISKEASYLSSEGASVVYRYTVQDGDDDGDGISVGALALNHGSIVDGAGNAADLTLNSVGDTSGVLVGSASIGDLVWNDSNGNGARDGGETGIDGVTIDLIADANENGRIDGGESAVDTATTAVGGAYDFTNLPAGKYVVDVTDTEGVLDGYNVTTDNDPLAVTLASGEDSNVADFGYKPADSTAPTLAEVTKVDTPTKNTTPSYTFSTDEAGTLAVGGSCGTSSSTSVAAGNVTVTLTKPDNHSALADGSYDDCTLKVTDAANNSSEALAISTFTIDTKAPTASIGAPDVQLTRGGPVSYTVTYAGADSVSLAAGDVTLSTTGTASGSVEVSGTGTQSRTVKITSVTGSGTLGISLAADTAADAAGNSAAAAGPSATVFVDNAAPAIQSATFDSDYINAAGAAAVSFTLGAAEVEADYSYTITSGDCGSNVQSSLPLEGLPNCQVSGAGTVTSGTLQVGSIDVSGLADGTLTLSVTLTDKAGNSADPVTDTAIKDTVAPGVFSVAIDQERINAANAKAMSFTFGGAEVDTTYVYTVESDKGGKPVIGKGPLKSADQTLGSIDVSGLSDGTLTLVVILADAAGNVSKKAVTEVIKDASAPGMKGVTIDQQLINAATSRALSFTLSGAEVGASFDYTMTSSGCGNNALTSTHQPQPACGDVFGSGTVSMSPQKVAQVDVSGLPDGTLTLTVTLADKFGNKSKPYTGQVEKDASAPGQHSVAIDQQTINAGNSTMMSFTFSSAEVGAIYSYTVTSGGSSNKTPAHLANAPAPVVSGKGTVQGATETIKGIDVSQLADGTLTLSVTLSDKADNVAAPVTDTATKDTVAPDAPSVPDLVQESDTGASNADDVTADNTPTFSGTAEPGATVSVHFVLQANNAPIQHGGPVPFKLQPTTVADGDGEWTLTLSEQAGGDYAVYATAVDTAGNGSNESKSISVTIDTTSPEQPAGALSVAENAAKGTAVGTVTAKEALGFSLADDADGRFAIDSAGSVTVVDDNKLDYETSTSHDITVVASDLAGNQSKAVLSVTVTNVNEAPTLETEIPDQPAVEDQKFHFAVPQGTFADEDAGDSLTLSATLADGGALPAWLGFAHDAFSGTPGNDEVGVLEIKVTGTDGRSASVSDTFKITVANVNDAPTVAMPISDQPANEDEKFNFAVPQGTFADVDAGDSLTLSATLADGGALPAWLAFEQNTFSGTPANDDVGILAVKVTATDGNSASVSDTFEITVANVNDAPTVAAPIPDMPAIEDERFSFIVPAGTFADDDEGDTLTLNSALADGSALPAWLGFANGTFSGTPTNDDVGALEVKVSATDGSNASVSDTFVITVANVNDAPIVATPIADQPATEDEPFAFAVPEGTFADEDEGDSLTLVATLADGSALPAWLAFEQNTFTGTPTNDDVGILEVKVTATDGNSASVSDTFEITVANVNDAPTVETEIPDLPATEDEPFVFTVPAGSFADVDEGDTLILDATLADGSALPAWLAFEQNTFTGTPTNDDVAILEVKVTATDGEGAPVSDTFVITVINVNDPPVAGDDTVSTREDNSVTFSPLGNDGDVDSAVLTVASVSKAAHGSVSMGQDGTVTYAPVANYNGPDSFSYTVSDGKATDSATVSVTVTAVNDRPVITGQAFELSVAQGGSLTLAVTDLLVTDPDDTAFTLGVRDGLRYSVNGTTVTAAAGAKGTLTVPVAVHDGTTASEFFAVTLIVTDGTAPTVTADPAGGLFKDDVSVTLSAEDNEDANPTITYSLDGGAPATPYDGGAIHIEESLTLRFAAEDADGNRSATAEAAFTIDLEAPVIVLSTLADGSVTAEEVLNVSGTVTDDVGVKGLTVNEQEVLLGSDGSFSAAVALEEGANSVTALATDQVGRQASQTFSVTRDAKAPQLTVTAPADGSVVDRELVTVSGSADEGATVTVALNGGDAEQAVRVGDKFSATVTLQPGMNTISVAAQAKGKTSSAKRSVTLGEKQLSLAITDPAKDGAVYRKSMTLKGTVNSSDPEKVTVTVGETTHSPKLSESGAFEQELTFPKAGTFSVIVTATDASGETVSAVRNVIYDPPIPMDVNGDGKVTPLDVLLVINFLNNNGSSPTPKAFAAGDVNHDGYITAIDALMIINHLNSGSGG